MRKRARSDARSLEALLSPELFKALCDPRRIALLCDLVRGGRARTVSDLASCCPIDLSVVSRHLGVLRDAGLVACERRGREVLCSVDARSIVRTLRGIADAIEGCCGGEAPGTRS